MVESCILVIPFVFNFASITNSYILHFRNLELLVISMTDSLKTGDLYYKPTDN